MTETINAQATQFALEVAYCEQKQYEAWDIVRQLSEWKEGGPFEISLKRVQGPPQSATFSFLISPGVTMGEIFSKLHFYYAEKAALFSDKLERLKDGTGLGPGY